ncbi:thiol reductant ABC exporter subunit CydD [Amycolatopsis acidiphila]|uniref:Thiol reductant ABC exporter subunit CydD n=1 Tax=Amycolatopsis acidiphila TaxID=715473 RepID=A0A558AMP6_9PSEU|nr:thiol reductant ABC exporter subunit CydD [Amycolatopsis acidiphila]TVT25501.1 thiol reductant ABC exporter subunit CydD [Amycolatopsis acidiphila]UIJ60241.1 thiol reductant ABC exporter subunit CydD [Amycolatopsis acidiphila]GHG60554.1 thiol reductant ABC exporter subunit CydC [Amycolatopsis acidiphila]
MTFPGSTTLPAEVSTTDTVRLGKGPLGALPALSAAARRALALAAVLALLNAAALVAQAFLLASACATIVAGHGVRPAGPAVLAGVVLGRALIVWAIRTVAARAAAGAKEELRAKAVDHALRLGPEWVAARGPAELTTLATKGLDALDAYFTDYLPALVTAAVVPLGAGAAILVTDWPSAVVIALTVPLLPLFAILVGKYTATRSAAATDALHRLSGQLLELVRALPVLAAFRRAEAQAETVRLVSERHRRATLKTLRVAFSSAFVLELAATLSVALVAVLIGVRLVNGDLPLAIGLGVLILAPECYQPLRSVGAAFHASEDGVEAVRRVADVLAQPVVPDGTVVPGRGEVRVEGLRVARRDGFAPDGESFVVRPGEITWLRSPSGAGKSTTLAVLLGFVRPASGRVTISDVDLPDVAMSAFRRQVAWVPQSPVFTSETVREELAGAADDLLAQLNLAGFESARLDQLSLGQRQRVAVARALSRDAWLLLLDEPTAHLDAANATQVMAVIEAARRRGAAVLIAAHERPGAVAAQPGRAVLPAERRTVHTGRPVRRLVEKRFLGGALLGALALVAGLALTATSGWLIAKASQQPPILTLTVAVVGVRAFGLGRAVLRYAERLTTHDAAFRIAGRLRVELWKSLVRLGPAHSLRHGESQRRLVADVDTVRDLLPRVLTPPPVAGTTLVAAIVVQTVLLPSAGLVLAVAVLLGAVAAPLLALRLERRATSALVSGRRAVSAKVLELFEGAAELLAFDRYRTRRAELAGTDAGLVAQARRQAFGAGAADGLITLVTGLAAVGGSWLAAGRLGPALVPVVALIPLALAEVLALLPPVAQHWDTLRDARTRLDFATPSTERPEHGDHVELSGDIAWPDGPPVLRDVDLEIPPGAHVAVVGASGAGKSTLLAALLGFLHPERGSAVVPAEVAWAPQDPQLVSTTVAENLRLADPHASDDRLADALRLACLPELRLDTVLGSAGSGLSGGQAQRLALARALVAAPNAGLVLLDEPTAHLDEPTARRLRANLRTALAGRTVVQVTHHPDEAADADFVLEVRDGRVTTRVPEGVYA